MQAGELEHVVSQLRALVDGEKPAAAAAGPFARSSESPHQGFSVPRRREEASQHCPARPLPTAPARNRRAKTATQAPRQQSSQLAEELIPLENEEALAGW